MVSTHGTILGLWLHKWCWFQMLCTVCQLEQFLHAVSGLSLSWSWCAKNKWIWRGVAQVVRKPAGRCVKWKEIYLVMVGSWLLLSGSFHDFMDCPQWGDSLKKTLRVKPTCWKSHLSAVWSSWCNLCSLCWPFFSHQAPSSPSLSADLDPKKIPQVLQNKKHLVLTATHMSKEPLKEFLSDALIGVGPLRVTLHAQHVLARWIQIFIPESLVGYDPQKWLNMKKHHSIRNTEIKRRRKPCYASIGWFFQQTPKIVMENETKVSENHQPARIHQHTNATNTEMHIICTARLDMFSTASS